MQTTVHIPGYRGDHVVVDAGQTIRLTDVEGTQIADLFAHAVADHDEFLCTGRTRLVNRRLFPLVGDSFVTNRYTPILTLTRDASPGVHDMLFESCDSGLHERLGAGRDHPNCRDNYLAAAEAAGITIGQIPTPVNFFQSTPFTEDGTLNSGRAPTAAGDHVELYAEMDMILIVTACSVDIGSDINGGRSTSLRIDVS